MILVVLQLPSDTVEITALTLPGI